MHLSGKRTRPTPMITKRKMRERKPHATLSERWRERMEKREKSHKEKERIDPTLSNCISELYIWIVHIVLYYLCCTCRCFISQVYAAFYLVETSFVVNLGIKFVPQAVNYLIDLRTSCLRWRFDCSRDNALPVSCFYFYFSVIFSIYWANNNYDTVNVLTNSP